MRRDQAQVRLESLRTLLAEAHEIDDIAVQSPLVASALYRFLLALLHRALEGPKDEQEWARWWRRGQFQQMRVERYLREVSDRFDLFHPVWPFYQTGNMAAGYKPKPTLALGHQHTAFGANPQRFGGGLDADSALNPAHAALLLLAFHPYALGGTIGRLPGESPSAPGGTLPKAAVVVVKGQSLFETLMLNMVSYRYSEADHPAWERGGAGSGPRHPDGRVDFLSLQTRRVCLLRPEAGEESVRHVQIARGWDAPIDLPQWEQMVAFRQAKKKGDWFPLGISEGRAAWRDLNSLLVVSEQGRPARNLLWVSELARKGHLENVPRTIDVLGMATNLFKILLWRRERLILPATCLDDPLLAEIGEALQLAEEAARAVRYQLSKLPGSEANLGDYWASLAQPFRDWLKCTGPEWSQVVQRCAWASFYRHAAASSASMLGHVTSEARLGWALRKMLAPQELVG